MFNLTPNQKIAAQQLFKSGNLLGTNMGTVKAMISKGLIEKTNGTAPYNYFKFCFTQAGQAWANTQFVSEKTQNTIEAQFEELCKRESFYVNAAERAISDTTWNFTQKKLLEIRVQFDALIAQMEA